MKKHILITLSILLSFSFLTASGQTRQEQSIIPENQHATNSNMQDAVNGPAVFRENVGQWDDGVLYKAHSNSTNVGFYPNKLSFRITQFTQPDFSDKKQMMTESPNPNFDIKHLIWNVEFVNANKSPLVTASDKSDRQINYFKSDLSKQSAEYQKLKYTNLYNNIDLKFYTHEKSLKYDFVVKPGGNVKDILLDYKGVKKLSINSQGQLLVNTEWGDFVEDKPFSYQMVNGEKKEVKVVYNVTGTKLTYKVIGDYDKSLPLVIDPTYDPVFEWGTYFGGDGGSSSFGWAWTYILSVDIDDNYNIYITGMTTDNDQGTPGVYDEEINGAYDGFFAKLNDSASEILFFSYLGGSGWDMPTTIRLDDNNNIYLYGTTQSSDFPTKNAYSSTLQGSADVFVCKFNSSGSQLIFSTYVGSNTWDYAAWGWYYGGETMDVLPNGEVVCAGMTYSSGFPVTPDAFDLTASPDQSYEGFFFKLGANGDKLLYSTYISSPGQDYVTALTTNSVGEVYIGGYSNHADFPYQAPAYRTPTANLGGSWWAGSTEQFGFFMKFGLDNKMVFAGRFGGNGLDWIEDIKVVENGDFYITGRTSSSNFPIQNYSSIYTVVQPYLGSSGSGGWYGADAFVSKFNFDGSKILFSTYLGGNNTEWNMRLSTNTKHEIIVTGMTASTNFPVMNSNVGSGWNMYDAFIVKLARQGHKIIFADTYGGNSYDFISATRIKRINCSENIVFGGFTYSNDIPTKPWVIQPVKKNHPTTGWAYQGFLAKYRDTLVVYPEDIDLGPDFVFCDNVNRLMDAGNPGADYLWSTGATTRTIAVKDTGYYSVSVTYGCGSPTKSDTVYLGIRFTPQVNIGLDSTHCNFVKHPMFGKNEDKPEATFKWYKYDLSNLPSLVSEDRDYTATGIGTYWLDVKNYCGTITDSVHIRQIVTPTITLPQDTTHCGPVFKNKRLDGENINNDAEYLWSNGSTKREIIVYDDDLYWVEVTNKCGVARDSIRLYNLLPPELDLGDDDLYCNKFARDIDAGNDDKKATYLWYPTMETSQVITVDKEGEYSVEVNNLCGVARDTVFVNNLTTPVANIPKDSAFCLNVNLLLDAGNEDNEVTYKWIRTNNEVATNTSTYLATDSGTYYVIVENVCGKDTSNMAFYTIVQQPGKPSLGNDTTYCGTVPARILKAENEEHFPTYVWYKDGSDLGVNKSNLIINGEGLYKVNVSNMCAPNGFEDEILIGRSNYPVIELGRDTNYCGPFIKELSADDIGPGAGALTYRWLPTLESTPYINVTEAQTYSVKAINEFGCSTTDYINITENCPPFVYVPNSFTPNGDGNNEIFLPSYRYVDEVVLTIYSRWGEELFRTNNLEEGWDGTFNGSPVPAGEYIYILTYRQTNQPNVATSGRKQETLNGNIILIR